MLRSLFLLFLINMGGCQQEIQVAPQKRHDLTLETNDQFRLKAWYVPPQRKKSPVWILLHGLGAGKSEWLPFAKHAAKRGHGWLAYDARGHGESTLQGKISYKNFTLKDWGKLVQDHGTAVKFLVDEGISIDRIRLAGASLGANISCLYASEKISLPAVVMLSPGLNYAGLETKVPIQGYRKRRILLASAEKDHYAAQSTKILYQLAVNAGAKVNFLLLPGSGHGVGLLDDKLTERILKWGEK